MRIDIEPRGNEPYSGYRLELNGVDIGTAVVANSVRITWENDRPLVEMTLRPAKLRAQLPDAVVRAVEDLG